MAGQGGGIGRVSLALIPLLLATATVDLPDVDCAQTDMPSELSYCARLEFRRAESAMNIQWSLAATEMKRRDAEVDGYPDGRASYYEALLQAQRKWLEFREAHCLTERFLVRGGLTEPIQGNTCLAKLTRERTRQLIELMEGFE